MIDFRCKCGNPLSVPAELAGELIQCPACGLAVDVPRLDDVPHLLEDGTIALEPTAEIVQSQSFADLHRTFTPQTVDEFGHEKDLRGSAGGSGLIALADDIAPQRIAPRYDPVTGELIRPHALKDEEPVPVLAIGETAQPARPVRAAVPSLTYATGAARLETSLLSIALDLFQPGNLAVMSFMMLFAVASYLLKIPLNTFALYFKFSTAVMLLLNLPLWIFPSQLGCTVEDTGPDGLIDLSRPLRNLALGEDFFLPIFRVLLASVICFLPAAVLLSLVTADHPGFFLAAAAVAAVGSFFFPAVVLTTLTGTTVLNLAPRRVLSLINVLGAGYVQSVVVFAVTLVLLLYFMIGANSVSALVLLPGIQFTVRLLVLFSGLALFVYMSSLFALHLGFLYRENHSKFPWVAQRHEKIAVSRNA